MMLWNAFLLALRAIRRNILRSSLTTLGIVIGVAAVITMVTIGTGATAQVTREIASMGTNLMIIRPGQGPRGPMRPGAAAQPFDDQDVTALVEQVPSLRAVAPSSSQAATAVYGNENWSTTLTGATNAYFDALNWSLDSGRGFSESELRGTSAVCVIGATVRKELFGSRDPIGARIRMGNLSCEVIGLLQARGQAAMGMDQDDVVLIPLRTFQRRVAGNLDINMIQVSVRDESSTEKAQRDIESLLRERRRIVGGKEDDFSVMDMKQLAETLTSTTQVLTRLLGAVAAVSLLVGGIGIMNIMLVSVTERTREIGIRLAIGALEREVLLQFLVEAAVLSSFGGVLGIVFGIGASLALTRLSNMPFVFNPTIVFVAFAFSAAVGLIFGYFPARTAARLNPIDALRHE